MTHLITPPPELVVEWANTIYQQTEDDDQRDLYVATRAAQWGADQELEACVKLLELSDDNARDFLYSARRPKPPSLIDLSPAVQAVLDAHGDFEAANTDAMAAALRAVADQVVPEQELDDVPGRFVNGCCHEQRQKTRAGLIAIAAELEAL